MPAESDILPMYVDDLLNQPLNGEGGKIYGQSAVFLSLCIIQLLKYPLDRKLQFRASMAERTLRLQTKINIEALKDPR